MPYSFVTSPAQATANVKLFDAEMDNLDSFSPAVKHDMRTLMGMSELFALVRTNKGEWLAGASKFVAVQGINAIRYSMERLEIHSGNGANHLRQWLSKTPVDDDHPGWKKVQELAKLHTRSGKVKKGAKAFVLWDSLAKTPDPTPVTPPLTLTEVEKLQVDLLMAMGRMMRPEVRNLALQEFVAL